MNYNNSPPSTSKLCLDAYYYDNYYYNRKVNRRPKKKRTFLKIFIGFFFLYCLLDVFYFQLSKKIITPPPVSPTVKTTPVLQTPPVVQAPIKIPTEKSTTTSEKSTALVPETELEQDGDESYVAPVEMYPERHSSKSKRPRLKSKSETELLLEQIPEEELTDQEFIDRELEDH